MKEETCAAFALIEPDETFLLDSYRFLWKEGGIDVLVDRLHEEKDGLKCEMTISHSRQPAPGLLREGRFNMSSPPTRTTWVKALNERTGDKWPDVDWYFVMEYVCAKSTRRWRQGEPLLDLADVDIPTELPYVLHPLCVDGASTVLFADGASGKSLIALACELSVATGEEILPGVMPMRSGPTIHWDWEWDAESHAERLRAICNGAGISVPHGMIFYQRELISLIEAAPRMRKRVAETGAVFGVIDSLGFARGGDANSQELTTRTFAALRTLGIPVMVIDHVSKDSKKEGGADDSFGSIYTRNSARMMWRLDAQKEEESSNFYAALVNRKANRKLQRTRGLNVHLETDDDERLTSITFEAADVRDIPGLNRTSSLSDQIEGIIRAQGGVPMLYRDIAECLRVEGATVTNEVVRVTLHSRKKKFVRVGERWALVSPVGAA